MCESAFAILERFCIEKWLEVSQYTFNLKCESPFNKY